MSKLYDAMMGLAVGDAMGVPFEFKVRDTFKVPGMVGYGSHEQEAGTWSDDTSLALATLESLGRCGKIDTADMMKNFASWLYADEFTARGNVFDVGGTTWRAIDRYRKNGVASHCGGTAVTDNGNGSLMRILPLAFVPHEPSDVVKVSALTHGHAYSCISCLCYTGIAKRMMKGIDKTAAVRVYDGICEGPFERVPIIDRYPREEIRSGGFVIDTLEAALWCLLTTESYRDCIITAVELGDDTDTVAAVAGGLAGIYYGIDGGKGIPVEWIEKIARRDWIEELCDRLEKKYGSYANEKSL